ncbi:hypothetical protein [Dactylosporangium matsuzakiense]|uniref:Uncharacterized protein n=1 Tax=Dactylosporangium matsuzakiense TaxID=53360 RepID=A0A9W6KL85_9ACTN|nr:hypothetical protein [Dactylosporangium matsuzakiense]GLL02195.1 hypothetical protein GCM10017581_039370 [Dactylosporangium matsuzakiense]
MLTAFAVDWADQEDGPPIPLAAASVYLRVRRHGSAYAIGEDTLSVGFRTTVLDDPAEVPHLLGLVDRALTRARRHAAILAGHRLDRDLEDMIELSPTPLRGALGVAEAWEDRTTKGRGLALMVDTADETSSAGAALELPLTPPRADLPQWPICSTTWARAVLARALAIGLAAAVHAGRYTWEGTFHIGTAIHRAAWDVLAHDEAEPGPTPAPDPSGRPDVAAHA